MKIVQHDAQLLWISYTFKAENLIHHTNLKFSQTSTINKIISMQATCKIMRGDTVELH